MRRHGDIYQVMFTPVLIGPHVMALTYGGQVVRGSPFTLNAYDVARVRITEASHIGALHQEMGLTGTAQIIRKTNEVSSRLITCDILSEVVSLRLY